MVLQTSCRCLRQVTRGEREKALIWMNKWNADKLNKELKQQQNITLQEFGNKPEPVLKHIERFSRMEKQKVPPIDFFQLKVEYETQVVEKQPDTAARLADKALLQRRMPTWCMCKISRGICSIAQSCGRKKARA